jgi:hypothetical protein
MPPTYLFIIRIYKAVNDGEHAGVGFDRRDG